MPDEALKPLGALSVTATAIVLGFIVWRWPKGTKAASISSHAGAQHSSYLLFSSLLTTTGVAFYLFAWRWFGPVIGAGWPFYVFLTLAGVFQLLTAWLPEDGSGSWIAKTHKWTAYCMAVMMQGIIGCILFAPHVGTVARAASILDFVLLAAFWFLFIFVKSTHRHFLVYQSTYIVSFFAIILLAAYIR